MTSDSSKLIALRHMLENAEMAVRSAKQLLEDLEGGAPYVSTPKKKDSFEETATGLHAEMNANQQIIEGVFDGQNMIGPNKKAYPVPANYASKSKLIPGDILKLTITPEGSFLYKQIGPTDRRHIKGYLAFDDGQYKVMSEGKNYKVLLASVTYFKANVGDEITLIIPTEQEVEWAAIENVIPRL